VNKRKVIWSIVAVFCAGFAIMAVVLNHRFDSFMTAPGPTEKELVEAGKKRALTDAPSQIEVAPLDLTRPVRLATGSFGFADDDQNRRMGDLVLAELTDVQGLILVERQSLDAGLREMGLGLSGLVRARDAVRVGKLLKADWFLLGTEAKIDGTNSIVVRLVDARTGIFQYAGAFAADKPPPQLAADIAGFVRQSRQSAATQKPGVFLAIGAFEDLSVNNRQAGFPTQLRGYLTAAYQGGKVTLLEREFADTLLQEVRLDLAGLTEESGITPPPMQSAFWLVDGYYQSYETTNFQVELTLSVQRIFGTAKHVTLRGEPGEPVSRQIKSAIDTVMNQNAGGVIPSRVSEARAQMKTGRELMGMNSAYGRVMLEVVDNSREMDETQAAKQKRNVEEAMRAFETVLLLEPTNREAKMYLASCLQDSTINRLDDARNYYREIIEDPVQDQRSEQAQKALIFSFIDWADRTHPEVKARWFETAGQQLTNSPAGDFYRKQAEIAEAEATLAAGGTSKAEELAKEKLFKDIQDFKNIFDGKGGDGRSAEMGMNSFVRVFGTNSAAAAQRLVELLPEMKKRAPELEIYILANVVSFQTDTNAPVIGEFQRILAEAKEHPDQGFGTEDFWGDFRDGICAWSFEHKLYALAVQVMEPAVQMGERLPRTGAGRNAFSISWRAQDRIALAYAYMGAERWRQALAVFESFTNQPVLMDNQGPWGTWSTPVLTGREAAYCRQKLGLPAAKSGMEFDMGKPLMCLCTPSTFAADNNGLWVGIGGRLLYLDFELKTNLEIRLSMDESVPISALCPTASNVWIATGGEGLIEFDRTSHQCRRRMVKDGLLLDTISSLYLAGETLWIGYGRRTFLSTETGQKFPGGLGKLDLPTGSLSSFTASLSQLGTAGNGKPTSETVMAMTDGATGDIWFVTDLSMPCLHRYRTRDNVWDGGNIQACSSLSSDPKRVFLGQYWNWSGVDKPGPLGVSVLDFNDGKWRPLKGAVELPSGAVSTLTLDGDDLWVGGMGYVALVDPVQDKVRKFAYVRASVVDKIQIGGGYVWTQYDWHLHRASLSGM
jgi:hypothetical protein